VGVKAVSLNIFRHKLIYKFSENHRCCDMGESYAFRVTQSAVQLRHFSGCGAVVVCFVVLILIVLLSRADQRRFVEMRTVPT